MANNVKYDGDDSKIIEDVYIPEVSYDWCKIKKCMVYDWLADGYCQSHWDAGNQNKPRKNYQYL